MKKLLQIENGSWAVNFGVNPHSKGRSKLDNFFTILQHLLKVSS